MAIRLYALAPGVLVLKQDIISLIAMRLSILNVDQTYKMGKCINRDYQSSLKPNVSCHREINEKRFAFASCQNYGF